MSLSPASSLFPAGLGGFAVLVVSPSSCIIFSLLLFCPTTSYPRQQMYQWQCVCAPVLVMVVVAAAVVAQLQALGKVAG